MFLQGEELSREVEKITKKWGRGSDNEATGTSTNGQRSIFMERYVFYDPARIPPGLHVIGVPTAKGLVWMEITPAEYDAATMSPTAAQQLIAHVREVLANRLTRPAVHDEETHRAGEP
jgi:hypothetical protein